MNSYIGLSQVFYFAEAKDSDVVFGPTSSSDSGKTFNHHWYLKIIKSLLHDLDGSQLSGLDMTSLWGKQKDTGEHKQPS